MPQQNICNPIMKNITSVSLSSSFTNKKKKNFKLFISTESFIAATKSHCDAGAWGGSSSGSHGKRRVACALRVITMPRIHVSAAAPQRTSRGREPAIGARARALMNVRKAAARRKSEYYTGRSGAGGGASLSRADEARIAGEPAECHVWIFTDFRRCNKCEVWWCWVGKALTMGMRVSLRLRCWHWAAEWLDFRT